MGRGPSIAGRKGVEDAKRGQLFTKLIREISQAARLGGADPAANGRLRMAIDKALTANMTKDTVERALKRAAGGEGADNHEIRYEGYGPGGIAVMVDCMTDNPTRTVAAVRHAFSKCGGVMGTSGSVAFQFVQTGELIFDITENPSLEEKILEIALDAGADDVQTEDGYCEVLTTPTQFEAVKQALNAAKFTAIHAEVTMRAGNRVAVEGENADVLNKLIGMLEDLDDVQDVYHNADIT